MLSGKLSTIVSRKEYQSIAKLLLVLITCGMLYYIFIYPPRIERGRTNDALARITQWVSSADVVQKHKAIMAYLANDVTIRLDVSYARADNQPMSKGKPAIVYEFSKRQFYSYLGNMLRSLSGHQFNARLVDFQMNDDWNHADVEIASVGSAEGTSLFVGKRHPVRFYYDALCSAKLDLSGEQLKVTQLRCRMLIPQPARLHQGR